MLELHINDNINSSPEISIIIPCYNSELFVDRAIKSVFSQTFTNWELILVNNNSTDNTNRILESYRRQNTDKVFLVDETKPGAPAARNTGLKLARGRFIQFLDADDEILPNKLQSQYDIAVKNNAAIVASPYTVKGFNGVKKFAITRSLYIQDFWIGLIKSQLGITSSNLWETESVMKVRGWNEELVASQEYDLMFRILQLAPRVGFDEQNLTIINVHEGESVSRGGNNEKGIRVLESRIGLRFRIKKFLKESGLLTKEADELLDVFIYRQLFLHYQFYPEFVKKRLKESKLTIPFKTKIKGKLMMLKNDIKRVYKKVV